MGDSPDTPTIARHDAIELTAADDGRLVLVRVLSTGQERKARYHHDRLGDEVLRWPRFVDPNRPGDYRRWLTAGWGGEAVRRL